MRKILLFLMIAAVHVSATTVCGVAESITDAFLFSDPSPAHAYWSVALKVLEFPFLTVLKIYGASDPPNYAFVMIFNSLLWAAVLPFGVRFYRKRAVCV